MRRAAYGWLGIVLSVAGMAQQPREPELPRGITVVESAALKSARAALSQARTRLSAANPYRKLVEARFAAANQFFTLWMAKSHPLLIEIEPTIAETETFFLEKARFDKDAADYESEVRQYSSTPITDLNRTAMAQWKSRLNEWQIRGVNWQTRLTEQKNALAERWGKLASRVEAEESRWTADLEAFTAYAEGAIRIGAIDARIAELEKRLRLDRAALERHRSQLPNFYSDVEAMAKTAESVRQEKADAAIGLAFSLAIDATVLNKMDKEMMTRAKIKAVKDSLIRSGLKPDYVKKILAGWEDPLGTVKQMRTERKMIEDLSQVMDLSQAMGMAEKRRHWEALAAALSILVKHPALKLVKTNVEAYLGLLHTGLAYGLAKQRVAQIAKLPEAQLKTINDLRMGTEKRIRELIGLRKEKENLKALYGL